MTNVMSTNFLSYICRLMTAKTYDYIVVLKSTDNKWIDLTSKIMLSIALVFFAKWSYTYFSTGNNNLGAIFIVFSLFIIAWWYYSYTLTKRGVMPYYGFAMLMAGWGWFFHDKILWASLLYLFAAVLEKPAKKNQEIAFDDNEIVINSYPKKRFEWKDLNNVVLKDGMLTIDMKSNKLLQCFVNDEVEKKIEEEFNAFCKDRLN